MGVLSQIRGAVHTRLDHQTVPQIADAAGLPPIRLHDLRHTWATLALAAGIPAKVVSERLGHAGIAITLDTYTHRIDELHIDAAEKVADLFR